MEIELKYAIKDKAVSEEIWEDTELKVIEEMDSRETLYMKAAYFDTEDFILAQNDIAYRVRMEGERKIASLKWNGKSEGALHTREEINVPVDGDDCFILPDQTIFKESSIGKELIELVDGKQLASLMEVGFLRRRFRVDYNNSIIEISIDNGDIITDNGSLPICEVELELFTGDQEVLLELGNKLAEKYGLASEKRSKYARGLTLANKMDLHTDISR